MTPHPKVVLLPLLATLYACASPEASLDAGDGALDAGLLVSCVVTEETVDSEGVFLSRTVWSYDAAGHGLLGEYDFESFPGGPPTRVDGSVDVTERYTRGADGRVLSLLTQGADDSPFNERDTYGYDAEGKLLTITAAALEHEGAPESRLTHNYTSEGQLLGRVWNGMDWRDSFVYDADGRRTGCGVTFGTASVAYAYTYDASGAQLTRVTTNPRGIGTRRTYTRDGDGNIAATEDAVGRYADQPMREWVVGRRASWTYEAAGNPLTRAVDSDASGRIDQRTTWSYDCDEPPSRSLRAPVNPAYDFCLVGRDVRFEPPF